MSTNAQSSALSPLEQAQYDALLEMLPEMFPNGYPPPAAPTSAAASTTTASAPVDPVVDPVVDNELISDVSQYIGTYLQCSEHQRTVLAFWVLHAYCFYAQDVTAYLSLQSAQPQAGKTRCLQLLSFLLHKPSLTCGLTIDTLFHRMRLARPSAILLDECQATFGTRSRPKAPVLRAILATNAHIQHGYMSFRDDSDAYVPKAFAGRGPLPEELAELCLPIIFEPLRVAQPPSAVRRGVKKLTERACIEAQPLGERLMAWSQSFLRQRQAQRQNKGWGDYGSAELPAGLSHLSYLRQDIVEPLLELAERLGGEWPQRLDQALIAIFEEEARFNFQASLDVLNAMYNCFFHYGFPERISTAVALEWLQAQPKRPWEVDGPMTARKLARLLMAFAISPRLQRMGKGTNAARGYLPRKRSIPTQKSPIKTRLVTDLCRIRESLFRPEQVLRNLPLCISVHQRKSAVIILEHHWKSGGINVISGKVWPFNFGNPGDFGNYGNSRGNFTASRCVKMNVKQKR